MSVGQGRREHTWDMFKIKIMESMVLVHEVMSWLNENQTLHLENRGLHDEFKRVYDLIRPYVALSGGVSHNVHTFCDHM